MIVSRAPAAPDFLSTTGQPPKDAARMQMSMLRTRYNWAATYALGKDLLEVAGRTGQGPASLTQHARSVKTVEIPRQNCPLEQASDGRQWNLRLQSTGALQLPFEAASFDLLLLFEALYCLLDLPHFLKEARRVLRPGGAMLISTVNPQWRGFDHGPAPSSYRSAAQLTEALARAGFETQVFAGFPDNDWPHPGLQNRWRARPSGQACTQRAIRAKVAPKRISYAPLVSLASRWESAPTIGELMIPVNEASNLMRYRTLYLDNLRRPGSAR